MTLNRSNIANDSYVNIDYIGKSERALLCHTDKMDYCDLPHKRAGEWYFPNSDRVQIQKIANMSSNHFYRNRGNQTVYLNRVMNPPERGRFNCTIPDSTNKSQSIYVNLGITVPDQI